MEETKKIRIGKRVEEDIRAGCDKVYLQSAGNKKQKLIVGKNGNSKMH